MTRIAHWSALLSLLCMLVFSACKDGSVDASQIEDLPAISGERINVIIEVPAGTNHKIEYDNESRVFRNDSIRGALRIIDFLPYPGNYGFIPGTYMDPKRGGDGDPLDVLLLSEYVPTGTLVTSIPIGTLLLRDKGEIDTKLIAIPADPAQRIIKAENFVDFLLYYDPAKRIIEQWFANYKGPEMVEVIRWEDDEFAWREIRRWMKDED